MDLILLFQENQELVFTYGVPMLLSLIVLFLIIRLYLVERRLNRLLKGSKRDNLEVILQKTVESNHEIEKDLNELYDLCGKLQRAAVDSLQNIGLCKFNALPDMGGDLSFALALLNNQGSGVVITSLAGRDDCRIYAKNIVHGKSPYLLSDEEKTAIIKALENKNKN
jgi:hypothetical protein